jgi:antitoxin CcdA
MDSPPLKSPAKPQLCEQKLHEGIAAQKELAWNAKHAAFIAAYNEVIEAEGVGLQEWRAFGAY